MRRVSVVGNSGSGKSTLGKALAAGLGVPYVELDAIFHQPGWTPLPLEEFRRRVAGVVAGERWVVDGNYSRVRDLVWERADTVVWLDLPRSTVMRQVIGRTTSRMLLRKTLWNGNREPLSNLVRLDPERSIIAWAWTRHEVYRRRFEAASADPSWGHLRFVRLRTRREANAFVEASAPEPSTTRSRAPAEHQRVIAGRSQALPRNLRPDPLLEPECSPSEIRSHSNAPASPPAASSLRFAPAAMRNVFLLPALRSGAMRNVVLMLVACGRQGYATLLAPCGSGRRAALGVTVSPRGSTKLLRRASLGSPFDILAPIPARRGPPASRKEGGRCCLSGPRRR